jgi:hypothetical protein
VDVFKVPGTVSTLTHLLPSCGFAAGFPILPGNAPTPLDLTAGPLPAAPPLYLSHCALII